MKKFWVIPVLLWLLSVLTGCGPGLGNSVNAQYWFDLGQGQFRDGHYDEAAVSLSRAEALATDNLTKAMIYREMARVYNASYSHLQEAAYMERAAEAFAMAGETRESNRALLETGQAWYNVDDFERAESLYKSALFGARQDRDTLLEVRTLQSYAALCLAGPEQDPILALEMLSRVADELDTPLSCTDKGIAAYAYSLLGERAEADRWLREAIRDAESEDEETKIRFREYQVKARAGDAAGALKALESVVAASEEAERQAARDITLSSQKEYFQQQSEIAAERLRSARMRQWVLALLLVLGLVAGWFIYRMHRLRAEQRLAEERAETDRVMSIAEDLQARLQKAGSSKILEKSGFSVLERLCEQFYIYEGTENLQAKVLKEAKSVIDGLRADTRGLEELLDAEHDGVMSAFRAQFPKFKEDDLRLFAYVAAGFSSTTLSTLLERDKQYVYNRIWRLKGRIAASEAPDKERFLEYFNK
ncbi:hypothetical protein J6U76_01435 [bacterium]|nr:hypothetical protein [bacterium]